VGREQSFKFHGISAQGLQLVLCFYVEKAAHWLGGSLFSRYFSARPFSSVHVFKVSENDYEQHISTRKCFIFSLETLDRSLDRWRDFSEVWSLVALVEAILSCETGAAFFKKQPFICMYKGGQGAFRFVCLS